MTRPRLLVLSASTGNGHVSAANAIADEARAQGLVAESVDCMVWTSSGFTGWYRGGYETLVRKRPGLWGHLYKTSDRPLFNYRFQTGLDWWFCRSLERLIAQFRPDWVICTHSLPQPRLDLLRRKYKFRIAIVVTDLYPHRMWLRGRPDHFFVPQDWSRQILEKRLPASKGHISVTGIPIHPLFSQPRDRDALRASMGLAEVCALVASGGIGGGPVEEVVATLRKHKVGAVVVAGRNQTLEQHLRDTFAKDRDVLVRGQVPQAEMADLMAACDFIVSKPGGLTTFEALAVGCPFLVYWPFLIPGQEAGNAEYLERSGAGLVARNPEELGLALQALTPEKLSALSAAGLAQAHPHAAKEIVDGLRALSRA